MTKSWLAVLLDAGTVHGQTGATGSLSERALQEFREGRYQEAERDFREIASTDPARARRDMIKPDPSTAAERLNAVVAARKARTAKPRKLRVLPQAVTA